MTLSIINTQKIAMCFSHVIEFSFFFLVDSMKSYIKSYVHVCAKTAAFTATQESLSLKACDKFTRVIRREQPLLL